MAGQVALAVLLLTAAGLVVRSFLAVTGEERGYHAENVIASTVQAWGYFQSSDERVTFSREAVERLEALPGVRSAGITSSLPLAEPIGNEHAEIEVVGRAVSDDARQTAHTAVVDAGYFETLGIPLRSGRVFDQGDRGAAAPVVLVNETLASRYWPGMEPVGERLRVQFWGPEREMEVVGVVADVRTGRLEEPAPPTLYLPHTQAPTGAMTFVVRTAVEPRAAMTAIREALWEFNDRMPIEGQTTLEALVSDSLRNRRFQLFLLGTFSALALVLAGIGIYGVISYTTRRRAREIGIRIALGAGDREIAAWALGQGGLAILAGLALGLAATVPLGRAVQSLLYGVEPIDPITLAAVTLLLGAIAVVAMGIPARAATRVDPVETMSAE